MKVRISTVICLLAWSVYGTYLYAFENGKTYGLGMGQKQLTEAHMIITKGMIKNTEGTMESLNTNKTATTKKKKSRTMPAKKKPAFTVTEMGEKGYLVRPLVKGGGTIQSLTLTMRFKGKA
jgi:hypothetical protein